MGPAGLLCSAVTDESPNAGRADRRDVREEARRGCLLSRPVALAAV